MKLYNMLTPELIKINCTATTTEGFLKELVYNLKLKDKISDEEPILRKLMEREKLGSTSIGNHSAVPHTKLKEIKEPIVTIGTSKAGIRYNEADKEPVHFIILILSPNYSPIIHLQILAAAASVIKKTGPLVEDVLAAGSPEELINVIRKYETSDD
ncbi:MAG: PTS transporter subunit EIIA [Candidatus Aminicenantes bacterium]|nr:PTS transporter subunit EIIA [Candidatus Aminicenantes bacterium]NIM79543.1 PTS transporter subunit EIIA [Candidatus Aminicenantes bacterium]NIN18857.1 PTS transporter subunit EIIA [Candidatus Aminicenantes bacterium]NIN42770.1 PTS transporter subunit EIIA [Candidatus Aminicenantes bacterium]NIN85497.1 PTS transporter subunit EIIA [Candidatus Aminicenantes bacterium]